MQELIDIIQEEAEILKPESQTEQATQNALYSAARKIRKDGPATVLNKAEIAAVRYALEDVGELYLYAGSSAGFNVETESQQREHRSRGRKAREQAAALGIHF